MSLGFRQGTSMTDYPTECTFEGLQIYLSQADYLYLKKHGHSYTPDERYKPSQWIAMQINWRECGKEMFRHWVVQCFSLKDDDL